MMRWCLEVSWLQGTDPDKREARKAAIAEVVGRPPDARSLDSGTLTLRWWSEDPEWSNATGLALMEMEEETLTEEQQARGVDPKRYWFGEPVSEAPHYSIGMQRRGYTPPNPEPEIETSHD